MSKLGLALSGITLVLSANVHISTFIPALATVAMLSLPLHLCAMASFILMILAAIPHLRASSRRTGEGIFAYWKRSAEERRDLQSRAFRAVPRAARIAVTVAFTYTIINFAIFIYLMEGGAPAQENGKYYLHNHGKKIRDLSEQEYRRKGAYIVRGFSGHWMLFSLMPFLFFAYVRPQLLVEQAKLVGSEFSPPP